ncbi:MAG: hypothetical protein DYG89_33515 [Caldilinea sp. CFX5]|nr:hypothetical protein [Caldilinea sp. CFX5]
MQLAIPTPQANPWFTRKVLSWLKRYLPAELTGTSAAIIGATIAWQLDQSMAVIALVGAWSEVVGFYLAMMIQEWRAQRQHQPRPRTNNGGISRPTWQATAMSYLQSVRQTIRFLAQILRNLVLEFGPAELVDPLFVRPALLALAMNLIPSMHWAVLSGKVAADLLFYTIAISSLELRRRLATKKAYNKVSQF